MTVSDFVSDLLAALAHSEISSQVTVEAEGPTVSGRDYLAQEMFLAFYFNQNTGTQAFALHVPTRLSSDLLKSLHGQSGSTSGGPSTQW